MYCTSFPWKVYIKYQKKNKKKNIETIIIWLTWSFTSSYVLVFFTSQNLFSSKKTKIKIFQKYTHIFSLGKPASSSWGEVEYWPKIFIWYIFYEFWKKLKLEIWYNHNFERGYFSKQQNDMISIIDTSICVSNLNSWMKVTILSTIFIP